MASRRRALRGARPRAGRLRRLLERAVLGAALGFLTFVLERRLRKALGRSGKRRASDRTAELG